MHNLSARIEELLNQIGMLVLTCDPDAEDTMRQSLKSLLSQLAEVLSSLPNEHPLRTRTLSLEAKALSSPPTVLLEELDTFISDAQISLRNPEAQVLNSDNVQRTSSPDLGEVDMELLVEFIEKHSAGLEDFEAGLLDPSNEGGDYAEASRAARGYIHNLKGDAGSIGLLGIERTCHFIEDMIDDQGVRGIIEPLLWFKEWCASWLKALAQGEVHAESAADFAGRFRAGVVSEREAGAAPSFSPPAASMIDDMAGANLDLLAELLAEEAQRIEEKHTDTYQISGDPEVFVEFVAEAEDHLGIVESTILDAGGVYDKNTIDTIFRGIHSIKGASSYFKLLEITETAHVTETLLDEVRTGKRNFDPVLAEIVLTFVDLQRTLIGKSKEAAASGGQISRIPDSATYLDRVKAYQSGGVPETPSRPSSSRESEKSSSQQPREDSNQGKGERLDIKNYVKVETERLDQLIDSIGEMSIYSSMLIQNCRTLFADNEHLIKVTHQVEKFGRELQHIGMSMRLIPIRGLFQKMSRLVWDVARKIGKEVKFGMEGEETELDRTIIDKLADPLMHMIRNAIDHGVETPEERVAAGKPRAGSIELKAFHAGGNIQIQIIDDGRGLNAEKLIKKAREKGIIGEHDKLTDSEAFQLIFAPGFSTAAAVTDISGRGVGMDVVRRNIESMRGRVHISSVLGKGTTFTIELPLTLAIIDGIQVLVGSETFIIPTLSVVEFMRPVPANITRTLDRGETYQFRGKFLPLYRLGHLFDISSRFLNPVDALVVVVEVNGAEYALMVDDIVSTHSTVIKSVGEMFGANRGIAGCAIMPTGDVALILDLRSLISMSRETYHYDSIPSPTLNSSSEVLA